MHVVGRCEPDHLAKPEPRRPVAAGAQDLAVAPDRAAGLGEELAALAAGPALMLEDGAQQLLEERMMRLPAEVDQPQRRRPVGISFPLLLQHPPQRRDQIGAIRMRGAEIAPIFEELTVIGGDQVDPLGRSAPQGRRDFEELGLLLAVGELAQIFDDPEPLRRCR
jgi:hypothetical protein